MALILAGFAVVFPALLVALAWIGVAGVRAGDRPGDVTIGAKLDQDAHPEGAPPVVAVEIRNPGPAPVLVGISVRRSGPLLAMHGGMRVRVPRRTTRPGLLPSNQAVVGVVDADQTVRWRVPAPARRHHGRLSAIAVVGQQGRLRVIQRQAGAMWPPASPMFLAGAKSSPTPLR
jgi:hypothetical protein